MYETTEQRKTQLTMDITSITVSIGNRTYPLKTSITEVETVRAAAQSINQLIERFEVDYKITDKQDLYSMCLIQMATELEKQKEAYAQNNSQMHNSLDSMLAMMNNHLTTNVL